MVNTGDWILLDGKTVQVMARWASGKHVQFTLSDGRKLIDLHKNPAVQIVSPEIKKDHKVVRGSGDYLAPRPYGTVEALRDETPNGEDLLD